MAKFQASHSPLELLDIVREVAAVADSSNPDAVSQRDWDAARSKVGHASAPRAHSIAQRLGVPWTVVLRIAAGPPDDAWRALRVEQSDRGRKGLTLEEAFNALRQVSVKLGKQDLTRSEYGKGREEIIAASGRSSRGKAAARALPDPSQAAELFAKHGLTWPQAVESAGLTAAPLGSRKRGTLPDLIAAFVRDKQAVPQRRVELRKWALQAGVSFPVTVTKDEVLEVVAAVQEERRVSGLEPWPATRDPTPQKAEQENAPSRQRTWDRASLIQGMAQAIVLLGPGAQLDQRTLKAVAAKHPQERIPSYSVVQRHMAKTEPRETWDSWLKEAEELARAT